MPLYGSSNDSFDKFSLEEIGFISGTRNLAIGKIVNFPAFTIQCYLLAEMPESESESDEMPFTFYTFKSSILGYTWHFSMARFPISMFFQIFRKFNYEHLFIFSTMTLLDLIMFDKYGRGLKQSFASLIMIIKQKTKKDLKVKTSKCSFFKIKLSYLSENDLVRSFLKFELPQ